MIALLDSGEGGLNTYRHLHALLPKESLLLSLDYANSPYGDKPREELERIVADRLAVLGGNKPRPPSVDKNGIRLVSSSVDDPKKVFCAHKRYRVLATLTAHKDGDLRPSAFCFVHFHHLATVYGVGGICVTRGERGYMRSPCRARDSADT